MEEVCSTAMGGRPCVDFIEGIGLSTGRKLFCLKFREREVVLS